MLFSPQPWDLLVWSEDQAKVCVADIRSGLSVKQVLILDPKEEDLEKVDIADFDIEMHPELREQSRSYPLQDVDEEEEFIRRYRRALDSEGNSAATNYATDYLEAAADRRRLHRQLGVVESDNDPQGLTVHEQQVLDAIMTRTRHRDEPRERGATPRSIRYPTTTSISSDLGLFGAARNLSSTDRAERGSAGQSNFHNQPDFTDYARVRNQLRERTLDPERSSYAPRRQSSIVLSASRSTAPTTSTTNLTDTAPSRSSNPIPPHAMRAFPASPSSDPWRTGGERSVLPETPPPRILAGGPDATQMNRIRAMENARIRMRYAREHGNGNYEGLLRSTRRQAEGNHDPLHGVRTAGLAMSMDGSKLYAGTEEGIFEFSINLKERRLFPAIVPR
jgi:hypothetical protein